MTNLFLKPKKGNDERHILFLELFLTNSGTVHAGKKTEMTADASIHKVQIELLVL